MLIFYYTYFIIYSVKSGELAHVSLKSKKEYKIEYN